jgi:pimeloyl-ACP methyl ester carboxylesterase
VAETTLRVRLRLAADYEGRDPWIAPLLRELFCKLAADAKTVVSHRESVWSTNCRSRSRTRVRTTRVRLSLPDTVRATLKRRDPKEYLFFNRDDIGKGAARAFVERLKERTTDRDALITVKAFRTQLKAIKRWGRATPANLSVITQPTLIANGDNDRMVPTALSEDMHRRIVGSEIIIYPNSGHGAIFQYHREFATSAIKFLDH